MNFVGRVFSGVKEFYKDINPATLSGALDIIVIEQEDGSFTTSPFHVRFGKMSIFSSKEKIVSIEVNGEETDLNMKLGEAGEAFFVLESKGNVPKELLTSPLPTPASDVALDDIEPFNLDDPGASLVSSPSKDHPNALFPINRNRNSESFTLAEKDRFDSDDDEIFKTHAVSSSVSVPSSPTKSFHHPLDPNTSVASLSTSPWQWGWGGLPSKSSRNPHPCLDSPVDPADSNFKMDPVSPILPPHNDQDLNSTADPQFALELDPQISASSPDHSQTSSRQSWMGRMGNLIKMFGNKKDPNFQDIDGGVYLDDLSEEQAERYFCNHAAPSSSSSHPPEETVDLEGDVFSMARDQPLLLHEPSKLDGKQTGAHVHSQDGEQRVGQQDDIALSLCGAHIDFCTRNDILYQKFEEFRIHYHEFLKNPNLLYHPDLVVRIFGRFCNWQVAAPFMACLLVYQKPLTLDCMEALSKEYMPIHPEGSKQKQHHEPGTDWWARNSSHPDTTTTTSTAIRSRQEREAASAPVVVSETSGLLADCDLLQSQTDSGKSYFKSLRLPSDEIRRLHLKKGANSITFSVATKLQGTATCTSNIFLWQWNSKIVISDVDGTITKSDALGHILPAFGRDWTHGGVAKLYSSISANGYHIVYLSSRAIGQADITRGYLRGVKQGETSLPLGPILLSPDRLLTSFHREVIRRKPDEFKIACLTDIRKLFLCDRNPFYAGFGNRASDSLSYETVGVPSSRQFIINPSGEVKVETLNSFHSSYLELGENVDKIFPPVLSPEDSFVDDQYNSFNYWRNSLPTIQVPDIPQPPDKQQSSPLSSPPPLSSSSPLPKPAFPSLIISPPPTVAPASTLTSTSTSTSTSTLTKTTTTMAAATPLSPSGKNSPQSTKSKP